MGSHEEPMGGLSNGPIPDPHVPPTSPPNRGIEKSPFEISAKTATTDLARHVAPAPRALLCSSIMFIEIYKCCESCRIDHHCGDDLVKNNE